MDILKGTSYDFAIKNTLRGCWMKMMCDAAAISNNSENILYCKQLRRLQRFFPCGECKEHFRQYLIDYPPENTIVKLYHQEDTTVELYSSENITMFEYIVKFMNAVSIRIGKPARNLNIMYQLYYDVDAHRKLVVKDGYYDFGIDRGMKGFILKLLCDAAGLDQNSTTPHKIFFCKQLRRLEMFIPNVVYSVKLQEFITQNPPEDAAIIQDTSIFEYSVNLINHCLGSVTYNQNILWPIFTLEGFNTCHDSCDGKPTVGTTEAKFIKL